jgi:AbrB family looped-hinge helix DNA binding protein
VKTKISIVTHKGQVVIPARFRRKFGIRAGTSVVFAEEDQHLVLQPLTPEYIESLRGSLGEGRSLLEALLEERRRDRER